MDSYERQQMAVPLSPAATHGPGHAVETTCYNSSGNSSTLPPEWIQQQQQQQQLRKARPVSAAPSACRAAQQQAGRLMCSRPGTASNYTARPKSASQSANALAGTKGSTSSRHAANSSSVLAGQLAPAAHVRQRPASAAPAAPGAFAGNRAALASLKAELAQLAEGGNVQLQSLKCGTAGTPAPIDASAELRAQVRTLHLAAARNH
jgi:hypothetical protein